VDRSPRWGLALAYAAICVIWGSTYLAIKVGLESFDPFFYAGLRYLLAVALLTPVALASGVRFEGPLRRWWRAVVVGLLFIGYCNGLVFWAETRLDSSFTALLITATPVWTALLQMLVPGERRLGVRGWVGIVAGFSGSIVLLAPWHAGRLEFVPALVVEATVVVWAATSLWVRRVGSTFHPMALTVVQMASGSAVLLGVAALRGRALVGPVTTRALAGLGFLVVFGSCVAFGAYFFLLRHWDAAKVSSSGFINPAVALVLGWLLLDERITLAMIVGTAVVLLGVALVLHEERLSRRRP